MIDTSSYKSLNYTQLAIGIHSGINFEKDDHALYIYENGDIKFMPIYSGWQQPDGVSDGVTISVHGCAMDAETDSETENEVIHSVSNCLVNDGQFYFPSKADCDDIKGKNKKNCSRIKLKAIKKVMDLIVPASDDGMADNRFFLLRCGEVITGLNYFLRAHEIGYAEKIIEDYDLLLDKGKRIMLNDLTKQLKAAGHTILNPPPTA